MHGSAHAEQVLPRLLLQLCCRTSVTVSRHIHQLQAEICRAAVKVVAALCGVVHCHALEYEGLHLQWHGTQARV